MSNGTRPSPYHHRAKSASEIERDAARITFNKTIEGHYRHGKTGYKQVGVLLLTWADDDMQCKNKEVAKLGKLFKDEFHFNTDFYEIPSERYQTALHKRISDFCYEYDSPEDLAIIYYGGHAYEGTETKQFKFAAKFDNADGNGDPTAFFNDIRTCVRLPACDQLMILDCCFAAKAFSREHVGKRKFELLTSSPHDSRSPAPYLEHSFTRALYDALRRLIKEHPQGFCTSHLYRELYHTMPTTQPPREPVPKPLLFDQARHSFGRIWLRPQILTDAQPKRGGRSLKLTFRLNAKPDLAIMNELALHLQFIPHVDQIRFEDLCAPKEQVTDFMRLVMIASKLKPLVRKLQLRRQGRKVRELIGQTNEETPSSLINLHLNHAHHPSSDWSGAIDEYGEHITDAQRPHSQDVKPEDWSSAHEEPAKSDLHPNGQIRNGYQVNVANSQTLSNGVGKRRRSSSSSQDFPADKSQRVNP